MLLLIGFKDKNFVTNNSDYFDLVNMAVFLSAQKTLNILL